MDTLTKMKAVWENKNYWKGEDKKLTAISCLEMTTFENGKIRKKDEIEVELMSLNREGERESRPIQAKQRLGKFLCRCQQAKSYSHRNRSEKLKKL